MIRFTRTLGSCYLPGFCGVNAACTTIIQPVTRVHFGRGLFVRVSPFNVTTVQLQVRVTMLVNMTANHSSLLEVTLYRT